MSLVFASGTLGCFIFQPEVLCLLLYDGGRAPDRSRTRLEARSIDGHRAVLARPFGTACRAGPWRCHASAGVVPHGPCVLRARAWPTAQGTVCGPFGRAVLPVGHGQFCRAGLARGPFKRES